MKDWTPAQWNEFFNGLSLFLLEASLASAFVGGIFAVLYALINVTQPMWGQSLNDKAFIAILTPLMIFLPTIIDKIIAKKSEKKSEDVQSN